MPAKKSTKKAAKKAAAKKAPTKAEIVSTIAADNDLTRAQVAGVLDSLSGMVQKNIGKRGPGFFTIPGLAKITVRTKPATKKRKGINPFTGEEAVFAAKPARKVVKVTPLKALKDMA